MNAELHTAPNTSQEGTAKFRKEVIEGLKSIPKRLSSKYLYDEIGDQLFQQIMAMPEYYLTKCELDIFKNRTADLAAVMTKDSTPFDLIELGAGDAVKSSYLLKYLTNHGVDLTYMPIDISGHILAELDNRLQVEIPDLKVVPLAGEYFEMLASAKSLSSKRKVVLFLGGNIGNMELDEITHFCNSLRDNLTPEDILLIGFDLKKNPHTILNAYNDNTGITAAFNLNLLTRMNLELAGNFDREQFEHYQTYDPISGACRSFLISLKKQVVHINETVISFEENEVINVEVSQKFSKDDIASLANQTGFEHLTSIEDSKGWFVDAIWRTK